MKFFATAVTAALLSAEVVLASPVTLVPRASRSSRSTSAIRRSRPMEALPIEEGASNTSDVSYSSNWAGAVLVGSGYKSVTGTFTVPTPKLPSGAKTTTEYAASAWVGLDGDTCDTAILQTGVDFNIKGSTVTYDAWYEWYPDYAYTFSGFSIKAGDVITVTATASSTKAGSVVVENVTTGKSVSHSFSGESAALCETNAEWIVEDFEEGNSLVPFANFGTVEFTGCSVTETSGAVIGASGAEIIDIKQNNAVLTSCSATSSTVTCTYE
ncbi:MAG: hypothetical protein STHCBS139747_007417 [Sporothrix thermara]